MTASSFPIGVVLNRNLTVRAGNCNHRPYEPKLINLVASGAFDPTSIITEHEPIMSRSTRTSASTSELPAG